MQPTRTEPALELSWLLEVTVTVIVLVAMVATTGAAPGPAGPSRLSWEVDVGTLDAGASRLVRDAFAAMPDIERAIDDPSGPVALRAPAPQRLAEDVVAPFFSVGPPALRFARTIEGDTVAYVGRATSTASPLGALVIIVQPTPAVAGGLSDEEHHRLPSGHWVHASVWLLPPGRALADDDSIDDAGVARRSAGPLATAPLSLGLLRVRADGAGPPR